MKILKIPFFALFKSFLMTSENLNMYWDPAAMVLLYMVSCETKVVTKRNSYG